MSITIFTGLTEGSKAHQLSKLLKIHNHLLVITADANRSCVLLDDVRQFCPDLNLEHWLDWDTLPFELADVAIENSATRIRVALESSKAGNFCIVAAIPALLRKITPVELLAKLSFSLAINTSYERTSLVNSFLKAGFKRVSLVQSCGDFVVRGNVIDFFPSGFNYPIRLEFFDTLLEKIKLFDIHSQRSHTNLESCIVQPVREIYPVAADSFYFEQKVIPKLKALASQYELTMREAFHISAVLRDSLDVPGIELYTQLAIEKLNTIFDYLPNDTAVIFDSDFEIERALTLATDQINAQHQEHILQGRLVPEIDHVFLNQSKFSELVNAHNIIYFDNPREAISQNADHYEQLNYKSHVELITQLRLAGSEQAMLEPLARALQYWQASKYRIIFLAGSTSRRERIQTLLKDISINNKVVEHNLQQIIEAHEPGVYLVIGQISQGFISATEKLVIFSETELFQRRSQRTGKSQSSPALKKILADLEQLTVTDFVVHEDFGIGRYMGLMQLTVDGASGDFLQIEYADSTLYLPAHNINKLKKYLGVEGVNPELDRLSAGKWQKTKAKVQQAAAEIAGDLLNLYAQRALSTGYQFEALNQLDQQFADLFAYDETPDQLAAINATLADMIVDRPMDRLVCGDVGFGKTEVAMRAAFKAVQSGKQVAVLAPTTILVEQHYRSFSDRFRDFSIKVGVLSRFHGNQANKQTLNLLASGELEIVIGTHKLLGRSVAFKDLGLLVIDEEHRFGVKQKEHIKTLKRSVDVLTLTATPIPRTLHMALCQVRDISVIATAPPDRRLIQTHVAQHNENTVRSLLLREQQRGGQSFFVHNRVQTLATVLHGLQELCPELRFELAHGQMPEKLLEDTMRRFIEHQIDVLVCTTIIESGLDIPNANTILIDRADTFGLAQLYQLRGRVGRSNQQAYCYFLVPPLKKINNEAHKRLKALQSLDDLGLGFNLAIRDLEIRGAGNILGREQSGNVFAVGYDLYSRILNQAIMNLRGEPEKLAENIDPEIKIIKEAFLPEFYIPDVGERLLVYQRLAAVLSYHELEQLVEELEDRFGHYGNEVENLIKLMRLRVVCRNCGIIKLERARERLYINFHTQAAIDPNKIMQLIKNSAEQYRLTGNSSLSIAWQADFEDVGRLIGFITELCARRLNF